MKLQAATLADDVRRELSGKLTMQECYDQLTFAELPGNTRTGLAIILRPSPDEIGLNQLLELKLVDPDNVILELVKLPFVPTAAYNGQPAEIPIPITLDGLPFSKYGYHRIDITVNDVFMGDIEVTILKAS